MSSSSPTLLEAERLTVRYPFAARPALIEVTERIERGDVVAIGGPSGCGKSTLLQSLGGFIPALIAAQVEGEVRLQGFPLGSGDSARVASRIGLVQQDPDAQICTLSVREEISFGPENLCLAEEEVDRRVEEALARTGLSALASRDTLTLSGGEKQRLAIASVLAMRPEALLLDEPTAHLDPPGSTEIFALLSRLRSESALTLVVAEHRLAPLLPLRPRLLLLNEGRVVARRSPLRREDLSTLGLRDVWRIDRPPLPPCRRGDEGLVLDSVSFGYGESLLLGGLTLSLLPGEILGVIGRNGSGKTTLLRLLAGLEKPSSGRIVRSEKARLGFLFQFPHQQIFERTVRRELEIGGHLEEAALGDRLSEARLCGLAERPPFSLSLGEQRRLALSTALGGDPRLLLLDEPFAGQDRESAGWVVERILRVRARGGVVIVASHDISLLTTLCDRLLYLGPRPALGVPREVLAFLEEQGEAAFLPTSWDGGRE